MKCLLPWILLVAVAAPLAAQTAERVHERESLFDLLNELRVDPDARLAGEKVHGLTTLTRLYWGDVDAPLWLAAGEPTAAAFAAARVLEGASNHGLEPSDYHHRAVVDILGAPRGGWDLDSLLELEVLLSDGLLRYGGHLLSGRLRSGVFDPRVGDFTHELDLVPELVRAATSDPTVVWRELEPQLQAYRDLQMALRAYRQALEPGGWPELVDGPVLAPGARAPEERLTPLRRRLRVSGDLGHAEDTVGYYDATLAEAVRAFQARHGLDADGKLGPATLEALRVPPEQWVRRIELALERVRWLPRDLGQRHLRVDITAYRLELVDAERVELDMRVVVGRPDRPTDAFSDEVRYLVFHPYWEVPYKLAVEDELPEIQKDVGWVRQRDFEVLRGWPPEQRTVDPGRVDWAALDRDNFPYRLRQRPGPGNSLGRVKFMFPNRHGIYLHDTPRPELFRRRERDLSSGCIRVEEPVDLAVALLDGTPGWNRWRVEAAIGSRVTSNVDLYHPMPVHLIYTTAWPDAQGRVGLREDLYDQDPPLEAALDELTRDRLRATLPTATGSAE